MTQQEYEILEQEFRGIRDERGFRQNTAVRIGTAFLDLLRMTRKGDFDEITFKKVLNKPTFLQGLITLGSIIFGEYAEGLQGGIITPEGVAELKELWVREHTTLGDGTKYYDAAGKVLPALEVKGDSTFTGNLSSPEFVSNFFGGLGWSIQKKEVVNSAGVVEYKYHLEIDDVTVRNTLRVFEMIISQLLGENANRYFSDMMEVDRYDKETGKIWLKTGNGRLYNPFRVGDLVEIQQYNGTPSEFNDYYVTKHYEMRITGVGLGSLDDGVDRLDWVTFDNFVTSMENGTPESLIKEYDTIVRADSETNKNRKGLVSIMAVGENTPYMDILYGMKTDPQHSLKGRIGNLEGVRTDLFGWLEGFGAYMNNFYGVGKFFNHQTGESLEASVRITRELFKSVYRETTYNIEDDDNFITNGYFQDDLQGWTKCLADGSAAPVDEETEMLGVNNGDGLAALLINGTPMTVRKKMSAEIEDKDGIKVLHLYGMGISQDFSLIKDNGTHLEMKTSDPQSVETKQVADTLYMGIRILPLTAGRLTVRFIPSSGGYTGWQRDINNSIEWMLVQSRDNTDNPWLFSGSGRMVVSYTGECYIRFVTLTTDATANSKVEYSTLFEQNARSITLQASKQTSDLDEAVASINLRYDQISQTVASNWTAFQTAKTTLEGEISRIDGNISDYNTTNDGKWASFATWQSQTNTSIASFATALTVDGQIASLSAIVQTVQQISQTVASNYNDLDQRIGTLSTTADSISGRVTTVEGWNSVIQSHTSSISSMDSELGSLQSDMQSANSSIGSLNTRVGSLEAYDSEVSMWVQNINSTLSSMTDPDEWQNGGIDEQAGKTFEECKTSSSNRIRYYKLVPITVATAAMLKSGYMVHISFFDKDKKCLSGTNWTGWKSPDSYGRVIFDNIPSNATYGAIVLQSSNDTLTKDNVAATGFFLSNDNVVSEAYMGVFIDNFGKSNAAIRADKITFKTGNFSIRNQDDEVTFSVDANGNVTFMGDFNGGQILDTVYVGSKSRAYMAIRPNTSTYGTMMIGVNDNAEETIRLAFDDQNNGALRLGTGTSFSLMSTDGYYTQRLNSHIALTWEFGYPELRIYNSSNDTIFGSRNGKIYIYADSWPTSSEAESGQVYLDGTILKVKA